MIPALILAAWIVFLVVALGLSFAAKRADDAIDAHQDRARSMGDDLDAIVIDFPQRRSGGGWVA